MGSFVIKNYLLKNVMIHVIKAEESNVSGFIFQKSKMSKNKRSW